MKYEMSETKIVSICNKWETKAERRKRPETRDLFSMKQFLSNICGWTYISLCCSTTSLLLSVYFFYIFFSS